MTAQVPTRSSPDADRLSCNHDSEFPTTNYLPERKRDSSSGPRTTVIPRDENQGYRMDRELPVGKRWLGDKQEAIKTAPGRDSRLLALYH